jgi:hypothetical protein
MKPFLMTLAGSLAITLLTPATAQADSAVVETCGALAELGASAVRARHAGVPLVKMYEVSAKVTDPSLRHKIRRVTSEAFDLPLFSTDTYQRRSATEYESHVFKQCLEGEY